MNRMVDPDVTALMVKGMESEIREAIIEQIKENAMRELDASLRERLKGLTIKSVDAVRNAMNMREEYSVRVALDGEVIR